MTDEIIKHMVYNYEGQLYCCHVTDSRNVIYEDMVDEHMIAYVMSGELQLITPERTYHIYEGQPLFIKRNHILHEIKKPYKGKPFKGLFFKISVAFLKQLKQKHEIYIPTQVPKSLLEAKYVNLEPTAELMAFFKSIDQYFATQTYPSKAMMNVKMQEATLALVEQKPELAAVLFDFTGQWKINLEEFMNQHFRSDLTVEQFAHFTGRSLTAFKKDFAQVFGKQTPSRWIVQRRLQEAKTLLERGGKPLEVYVNVGFKSLSHFSTAFKKEYGIPPTQVMAGAHAMA